jgi:hypothetical protein
MIRRKLVILLVFFMPLPGSTQNLLSVSSDFSVQHNFRKTQNYWSLGPCFNAIWHLDRENGITVSYGFTTNGKFRNQLSAYAKQPTTIPQQVNYKSTSNLHVDQFSIGWRKYLKGHASIDEGWNLYSNIGFGLLSAEINNSAEPIPDTLLYNLPVTTGEGQFKRLTIDVALGFEVVVAGDIYAYSELKSWIPTSSYPSKYLLANNDAPLIGMLSVGLRVLF